MYLNRIQIANQFYAFVAPILLIYMPYHYSKLFYLANIYSNLLNGKHDTYVSFT
jgi:hypothetical protein